MKSRTNKVKLNIVPSEDDLRLFMELGRLAHLADGHLQDKKYGLFGACIRSISEFMADQFELDEPIEE
jgi:hypothetical protein